MTVQWEYLTNSDLPLIDMALGLIQSLRDLLDGLGDDEAPAVMALVIGLIRVLYDSTDLLGQTLIRFGEIKPSGEEIDHDPAYRAGYFLLAHVQAIEVGLSEILRDHPNFATAPRVLRPGSRDGDTGRGATSEDGDSD